MRRSFMMGSAVAFIVFIATACGGGKSDTSSAASSAGASAASESAAQFMSLGRVTGLGSIIVNGVEFEIEDAHIIINGEHVDDPKRIKIGMKVEVEGELNDDKATGIAEHINVDDEVVGAIESVEVSASGLTKTLIVMGQTVIVEEGATVFEDITFASLTSASAGVVVEVSGVRDSSGVIRASFIETKAVSIADFTADELFEVMGEVSSLSGSTFMIGALTVDFSNVAVRDLENAPNGILENGVLVEAKGSLSSDGTLIATDVEVKEEGLGMAELKEAEIEGIVMDFNSSAKTFVINGQVVSFASAEFEGGIEADLMNDIHVEAEGSISGGVLIAEKIKFKENIRFEANALMVNAESNSLTLENLPGITIKADESLTEFKEITDISAILAGNNLKIRGRLNSKAGTVVATRIEIKDVAADSRLIIQGPVTAIDLNAGSISIMGIQVDLNQIKEAQGLNLIKVGSIVKAKADTTPALIWREIELED